MISSVIAGLEAERDAAASAIALFGHDVLRSEQLGASADTPERACLDLVRRADVVILILGDRYGQVPSGRELSATHQEYREARELGRDVLAFVYTKDPEPRQRDFIREVRTYTAGGVTTDFTSADHLRDLVIRDLRGLELQRAAGRADPQEMLGRARHAIGSLDRPGNDPTLAVAVAFGPAQQVVRPRQLADSQYQRALEGEALYGTPSVLIRGEAVKSRIKDGRLLVAQDQAGLLLAADGTFAVSVPMSAERDHLPALIEEDVIEAVERVLRFTHALIDRIDPTGRLADAVAVAALGRIGYSPWLKRDAAARSSLSYNLSMRASEQVEVWLDPPQRRRKALLADARSMAEDLVELLRQRVTE